MELKLKKDIVEHYQLVQMDAKKYTVLLVDDELANLEGLAAILAPNYNILTAHSGAGALRVIEKSMLASKPIHLIISDQRMPNMTGVQFFEHIIPLIPDSIRILLTGFADIKDIIDAINRGAIYKYLTKPIGPFEVQMTVQRALEHFELNQKNQVLLNELRMLNAALQDKVTELSYELAEKQRNLEKLMQNLNNK